MTDSAPLRPRPVCDFGLEDHRQSTRFLKEPGTDFAVVRQPTGEEVLVEVHDESLTGICLVLSDASCYPVGTLARLVYHATLLVGEVRHVTPRVDGTFLVGLSCQGLPQD